MTYALFRLHAGAWHLLSTWEKLSDAKQELAYLTDTLGVKGIKLFHKPAPVKPEDMLSL